MNQSKSGQLGRDRLSELPDPLILIILSFLPMRDVVQTTFLSKRWNDLWTSVPCLNFSDYTKPFSDNFRNFVNLALLHWKGTKIRKFGVDFSFHNSYTSSLDTWLRIAIEKGVEELHIDLMDPKAAKHSVSCEYSAPKCLLSYSSIRKLSLVYCDLKIKGNVQWDQLKCLTIDRICLSEEAMNQVLSGAPQLEVLILNIVESYGNLNIRSSSLKTLMVKIEKGTDSSSGIYTELTIWAPNVGTLEITGVPFSKYMLMDVSSLTNATVGFYLNSDFYRRGRSFICTSLEEIMGQVFLSISHLEIVALSNWCIKVLGEMKKKRKGMLASLSNAKVLKLYATRVNEVVDLLEIFPKLTTLAIEQEQQAYRANHFFGIQCHTTEPFVSKFDAENSLESKTDILMQHLLHLKTVEITWAARDRSIFSFIEILSKNVGKLEILMLRVTGIESPIPPEASDCLIFAAQKLLSVQKSFPTAEVIIRKD